MNNEKKEIAAKLRNAGIRVTDSGKISKNDLAQAKVVLAAESNEAFSKSGKNLKGNFINLEKAMTLASSSIKHHEGIQSLINIIKEKDEDAVLLDAGLDHDNISLEYGYHEDSDANDRDAFERGIAFREKHSGQIFSVRYDESNFYFPASMVGHIEKNLKNFIDSME